MDQGEFSIARPERRCTPLTYAMQHNQYPEVITTRLKAGADAKAKTKRDEQPLTMRRTMET
jgi:hypothetical protein